MKPSRLRVDALIGEDNMNSLMDYLAEYKTQLDKGFIQQAYRRLMLYMLELRNQFQMKCPDYEVSGSIFSVTRT